jgi:hypothetical protein
MSKDFIDQPSTPGFFKDLKRAIARRVIYSNDFNVLPPTSTNAI